MKAKKDTTIPVLRQVASFLRPHSPSYVAGIIGIGFANLFINVFLARMLMDLTRGIMELSRQKLTLTAGFMIAGTLVMMIWVFVSARLLLWSMHRTANDIRQSLVHKFVDMPLGEIEERHSGDLVSRSTTSLRQINNLLVGEIQSLMNVLLSGIGSAVYMLLLDRRMGVVGILCGFVPLLVNLPFAEPLRKTGIELQKKRADFTQAVSDILVGRDTIRHMNLRNYASARAGAASNEVLHTGMTQTGLTAGKSLADGISSLSSLGFFLYVSSLGIQNPTLIPAAIAMTQLSNPVRQLFSSIGSIISRVQSNLGGAERVVEVLNVPDEPKRYGRCSGSELHPPAIAEDRLEGMSSEIALEVRDLSFQYPRSSEITLSGITVALCKGHRTALVGPSGGGKSTLVKVIIGLYPPTSGEITAFGQSMYSLTLRDWRRFFSYVPQNAFLFAGSVYDNILGGMDDPGRERVLEAARLANAHDFISALPDGYDSLIGERGTSLSGGQKQRIAIARALLRNAPILLLDEATAALDAESEAMVQEAQNRLMSDRTTLVVAHRLSTVRDADEILVIGDGSVAERGRHVDLMAGNGIYRQLVEERIGGRRVPRT